MSNAGQLLASGGDGGEILLWKRSLIADEKPCWRILKTFQLHVRDVLDLAWSPDSALLMSGSVDNQCMIWDVATGKVVQILNDHQHFVQGVAWDPAGEYLASISSDRTCRIYARQSAPKKSKKRKITAVESLFTCRQVLAKTEVATPTITTTTDGNVKAFKAQHLFHDENMPSFFRRLAWSPDASLLIVPSGLYKMAHDAPSFNMTYIYSRKDLSRPCIHLPAPSKPVVAVRFCPAIFALVKNVAEKDMSSGFSLPYRLVFAVATVDSLIVYDTQRNCPIVVFAGIHYAAITDIAWSADGRYVAVSSQDGYCSLLAFSKDELGTRLSCNEAPANVSSCLPETVLANAQQSLTATSAEMSLVSEPGGLVDHDQSPPDAACPRPLRYRRITLAALPASLPPNVLEQPILPISISVPSPSPLKTRKITPVALAEDSR
ncbi:hypothetical protein KC19_VG131500 [Ceratodon purpureus]|uniref:CAF1B/HIR1 beta-propeller domain-containing protein n=1 Tax=Ceratodon purpureus TaxID=3225 RepID=A0A8T0HQP5_CERPU|nr:hypothetical protein KC19_VG131500 [Ceratodon purpureus]